MFRDNIVTLSSEVEASKKNLLRHFDPWS